jgi:hypothetical protein
MWSAGLGMGDMMRALWRALLVHGRSQRQSQSGCVTSTRAERLAVPGGNTGEGPRAATPSPGAIV